MAQQQNFLNFFFNKFCAAQKKLKIIKKNRFFIVFLEEKSIEKFILSLSYGTSYDIGKLEKSIEKFILSLSYGTSKELKKIALDQNFWSISAEMIV